MQAVEMSQNNSYWHCRLLFQLASIHAAEKDYASAVSILGAGVDFAYVAGAYYTRLLFMLSKTMVSTENMHLYESLFLSYPSRSCFSSNGNLAMQIRCFIKWVP